jgi:methylmalonyl-CoA mutase C-terminal domain/subunit
MKEQEFMKGKRIRVLIAKPGLDGHDRGAKVVALALRDAGMEVIYSGLHRRIDEIIAIAIQESVDVIGLSIMSGSHLSICKRLMERLKENDLSDILVAVGGVIAKNDVPKLEALGVKGVFPGGTRFDAIVDSIRSWF